MIERSEGGYEMPEFKDERELLQAVRDRLDSWVYSARSEAYSELFEGPDAILEEADLKVIDEIDSQLTRREGWGIWGADEYGIVPTGTLDEESVPHVVCTNHPQVPEYGFPSEQSLDAETRERCNEALWEYCERVVELVQHDLEEFVWSSTVRTWNG